MMATNVMTKQRPAFVSQAAFILPSRPGEMQKEFRPGFVAVRLSEAAVNPLKGVFSSTGKMTPYGVTTNGSGRPGAFASLEWPETRVGTPGAACEK